MGNKTDQKREDLRNRLVIAAEEEIAADGLAGLKARTVTQKAGCALGALYNVVTDLDGLIILVNSKTIARLNTALEAAATAATSPEATLQSLAAAYVDFALSDQNLWFSAFNHRLPDGRALPDWHQAEYLDLIRHLTAPLAELMPHMTETDLILRSQTLFAAVHGIVQLSLNGQFAGAPKEALTTEVAALVEALAIGLKAP